MADIICIVCPKGCHLSVDETTLTVIGNNCPRGAEYGRNELENPVRVVTSTVKVIGAPISRCPVKTLGGVPKGKVFDTMNELKKIALYAPVHCGSIVLENVCGTGVNVVTTRELPEVTEKNRF